MTPLMSCNAFPVKLNTTASHHEKDMKNVNAYGTNGLRGTAHGIYINNRAV